ncbi:MAG: flagellar basal body-associated FliL family protein [Myxococcota bacterium]
MVEELVEHITITYLSSLRLKDTQGPGALDRTRAELERRFNHVLTTGEVEQVYFTDFVTQ